MKVFASVLAALALALVGRPAAAGEPPLALKVITLGEPGLHANITLVMGDKGAVLIDAPFTRADAHRVVAEVLDSGKRLETIYVTHDHPDHFFSMEVLTEAFPEARVLAHPVVVEDIRRSIPFKMRRWGPMLGANGPRNPVPPTPLQGGRFTLEGHDLEVIGPMQGDHVHATAVHIPSLKALVVGDLAFDGMHLWLGEHRAPERAAWLAAVDRLIAMKPAVVVAGHKLPGRPDDPSSLSFTRSYLVAFEQAVATSRTSAEVIAKMRAAFPDSKDVLGDFLLGNSAKVAVGEAPPWEE